MQIHAEILVKLINKYNPKTVVEVGVYRGDTALAVKNNCNSIEEYNMVDRWEQYFGKGAGKMGPSDQNTWEDNYKEVIRKFKNVPNFKINRTSSLEGSEKFKKERKKFDLVFIDGDHSYEAVREDIEAWFPLVSANGILCGDDAYQGQVMKAVKEKLFSYYVINNRVWVAHKITNKEIL